MRNKPILTNWAARMLGLAPDLFEQCSSHLKTRSRVTLFAMLVLHCATSFTITMGLYKIIQHKLIAILIFLTLISILFTADRLLITSSRHWSSSAMRLLLAIVLPILNMAFFDLFFFDLDIKTLHQEKLRQLSEQIQRKSQAEIDPKLGRIEHLNLRIESLNDSIRHWKEINIKELNGTGGTRVPGKGDVFETQQPIIDQLASDAEMEITGIKRDIREIKRSIAQEELQHQAAIEALPVFENTGFAYRLNLLHAMIGQDGNWMIKITSCFYFLFFVTIDGFLLLPVIAMPFEEYHIRAQETIQNKKLLFQFRQSQLYQLHTAEVQMEVEQKLLALQYDSDREAARHALQDIEQQLIDELKLIEALQQEEKDIGHKFHQDFEKMAQVALIKSMDRLGAMLASA